MSDREPIADPELRAIVVKELRGIQDELAHLTERLNDAMGRLAQCDGCSPDGEACMLGWHRGWHKSLTGFEWLDS